MDIAKVDREVAQVVVVVYVCYKHLFQIFYLFFQTYVANVFLWILYMFYVYVTSVLGRCCIGFVMAFSSVLMCFFKCFICLQMHNANISSGCFERRTGVAAGD
jgi:hypothetical protein